MTINDLLLKIEDHVKDDILDIIKDFFEKEQIECETCKTAFHIPFKDKDYCSKVKCDECKQIYCPEC